MGTNLTVGQLPQARHRFVEGMVDLEVLAFQVCLALPPSVHPDEHGPDVVGRAFPDQEAIARDAAGFVNQGGGHRPVAIVERGLVQRCQDPRERVVVAHGESSFSQARMNSTCDARDVLERSRARSRMRLFCAANSRQRIAGTPAPPSHYPIGRIRKETIQEAAEAGELPDDEHVARSARAHAAVESRAVVAGTGRDVVVDVDGVDARGPQGVAL